MLHSVTTLSATLSLSGVRQVYFEVTQIQTGVKMFRSTFPQRHGGVLENKMFIKILILIKSISLRLIYLPLPPPTFRSKRRDPSDYHLKSLRLPEIETQKVPYSLISLSSLLLKEIHGDFQSDLDLGFLVLNMTDGNPNRTKDFDRIKTHLINNNPNRTTVLKKIFRFLFI